MVHEHGGYRGAGLEGRAERADRVGRDAARVLAERLLGDPPALRQVEPEAEQLRHDRPGAVAAQAHRRELARLGVGLDEERVEDAQRAARLDPLKGTEQLPLERGIRAERIRQELRRGRAHLPPFRIRTFWESNSLSLSTPRSWSVASSSSSA